MKTLIGIFIVVGVVLGTQYTPIPKTEYGLSVGDPQGKLHVQAFYDLLCPDSATSDQILRQVFKTIIPSKKSIRFTYNFFPLPYHFYSFKVQQGYNYVFAKGNTSASQAYVEFIFDFQDYFGENNWRSKTITGFVTDFADTVNQKLGLNKAEFINALALGSPEDSASRKEWKYSGTSNSISGTPIFYANGVRIDGAEDWKYGEWLKFFEDYTSVDKTEARVPVQVKEAESNPKRIIAVDEIERDSGRSKLLHMRNP